MSDELLVGYDDKTMLFRRYKNLQHRLRHQISRLHLRNNPYREGHPRSFVQIVIATECIAENDGVIFGCFCYNINEEIKQKYMVEKE